MECGDKERGEDRRERQGAFKKQQIFYYVAEWVVCECWKEGVNVFDCKQKYERTV